jgi:rhamnulokinase
MSAPMPERIAGWCRERGVPVPTDDVALVRLILDGLAAAYRAALTDLETVAGRRFSRLNIVGGGSNNRLLNQLTADAIGRDVIAGPGEATALGNLLVQARAVGLVKDASDARAVLGRSVELTTFHPLAAASR